MEGAFGVIKQDMGFTRFKRRGLKNVKMEFLIVCLGYNLKKYHQLSPEKREGKTGEMASQLKTDTHKKKTNDNR